MRDGDPASAAEDALNEIAALCGCPEWQYPGQVVRDVMALRSALEAAQHYVNRAPDGARPRLPPTPAQQKLRGEIEALLKRSSPLPLVQEDNGG